jgi:CPA2 family monovalent cation:H+ antiporter-2
LIIDLGLILITAGVVTLIFKFLKQPLVLGYIVAGFLVGPHFIVFPSVADLNNITVWSEVGVIILLFALGIEFSFKKLMNVGATAGVAGIISIVSMLLIGYLAGLMMGLSEIASIFFGGMLSMSSTTIIIKAFGDMGLQKKRFARIVFGVLIVEDLAAILMMVVFTALATVHSASTSGAKGIIGTTLILGVFVLTCFVAGIFLIPTALKRLKKFLSDETLLIVSVGLCLGMVIFSDHMGYSAALGAFMMGAILAETVEAKRIEHLINPLKDLFGAIFFVSVGMMIVPASLVEYAGTIALVTVIVLVGRIIFDSLGVLASGESLKTSLQAGMSLAQIGEFSFIIATLGMNLKVLDDFIYPVIVTVSVITTFTTPYCIKLSEPFYNFIEKRFPDKWHVLLNGYGASQYKTINEPSVMKTVMRTILPSFFIYTSFLAVIAILSSRFAIPFIVEKIPSVAGSALAAVLCVGLMAPFIIEMTGRKENKAIYRELWDTHTLNKTLILALMLLKLSVCTGFVMYILLFIFPQYKALILLASIIITAIIVMIQGYMAQTGIMERRFIGNFSNSEGAFNEDNKKKLNNNNIHLEEIVVSPDASIVGKTLAELALFNNAGANIVSIERGSERMNIPDKDTMLFPHDRLIVAATDEDLNELMTALDEINNKRTDSEKSQIGISLYDIAEGSALAGKTIRELDIRNKTQCMIIGIDRDGVSIQRFSGDTVLLAGDVLWLAGEEDKLEGINM